MCNEAAGDEDSLVFCAHNARDFNNDGLSGLLCRINIRDTGFQSGDTAGILKGQMLDGTPLAGSDSIAIIGQ